jgi:hypothetical protein
VWGAVFVGRGADRVSELSQMPHDAARRLVEAVSSGAMPAGHGGAAADAARAGFLSGMNELFLLGGIVAFVGALLALILIRPDPMAHPTAQPAPAPERL